MKIVIAIDSFKGSASSKELSSSIKEGIKEVYNDCKFVECLIADGGEGTVDAMAENEGAKKIYAKCSDPLGREIQAYYTILKDDVAVIEMASASGLPLLNESQRNPSITSTYGTGELIADAISRGVREFIIGLGGSATNDAGLGMLRALGFRFFDDADKEVVYAKDLSSIRRIDRSEILKELSECSFKIACDVNNPLYGKNGASYVYAGQKGADYEMIEFLDLQHQAFAKIVEKEISKDVSQVSGVGAGGGIGFGFLAFLNAELKSGIEIILDEINFRGKIKNASFVITGEGKIDRQSTMGKVIDGIASKCVEQNIPCIAFTGNSAEIDEDVHHKGVVSVFSVMDSPISLEEAMNKETTLRLIKNKSQQVFRLVKELKAKDLT